MTFDTLQYVDGAGATQEVAINLGNLSSGPAATFRIEPASHAPGKCTIAWTQPPETGIAVPFKSRCVVRANRASSTGANNSFSAGSVIFIGRRTDNPGSASSSRISTSITIEDFLWDLSKVTYQQASNQITGGTLGSPTYTPFYWPDVVLFQALPGTTYSPSPVSGTITTWQQIEDILTYAQGFGAGAEAIQFQFSTTPEFTALYRNWYPLRSCKCLEAILNCLRTHPGVFTEVDYTTTLAGAPCPTIHFRVLANMTGLTLPYKSTDGSGRLHLASEIMPLPHLIPDAIRLYYRINGTFNGQPVINPGTDIYPLAAANSLLCFDYSIDVTGATQTETVKNFVSATFDPTLKALWRLKVAGLQQVNQGGQVPNDGGAGALTFVSTAAYDSVSNPKGIQVLGDDGIDYSTSYGATIPYITDDSIFAWFQLAAGSIIVKSCTVKAYFSYNKVTIVNGATVTDQFQEHQHTFRCILCSLPTGQYILKQTLNGGETIPSGLAQYIWTELQILQWKLTHQIFQIAASNTTLPTIVKPGKHAINLSGGAAAWTTMNAIPQRVTIDLMRVLVAGVWTLAAKTSISCGPVDHLNPDALIQLNNVFRMRGRDGIDAAARLTGNCSSTQVDLSLTANGKENSMPSPALASVQNFFGADATSGNNNQITADATLCRHTVAQLNASTGANIASAVIVPMYSGAGAPSASTLAATGYFRALDWYIDTTANALWSCTSAGPGFYDAGSNPTGSKWVQVSGGGGGTVQEYTFTYDRGDFFMATPAAGGAVTTTLASGFGNAASVTTLSVTNATGIAPGQSVSGTGVPAYVIVVSVSGTTVTTSGFTSTAASSGNYTFGTDVAVAKPPKLWCSIAGDLQIDGSGAHTYTYASVTVAGAVVAYTRTNSWNGGANTQTERITPAYLVGDTIFAQPMPAVAMPISPLSGTSVAVNLIDIHDKDWAV